MKEVTLKAVISKLSKEHVGNRKDTLVMAQNGMLPAFAIQLSIDQNLFIRCHITHHDVRDTQNS